MTEMSLAEYPGADRGQSGPEPLSPEAQARVMDLLAERIPLSLIMDMVMPEGPHSTELLRAEGEPELPWWEPA